MHDVAFNVGSVCWFSVDINDDDVCLGVMFYVDVTVPVKRWHA